VEQVQRVRQRRELVRDEPGDEREPNDGDADAQEIAALPAVLTGGEPAS